MHYDCKLPIEGTDVRISVDDSYKHLRTTAASNASLAIEIAQRRLKHSVALGPIRKALFKRGSMPQRKLLYVDSLATSPLTVHSGAWEPLSRPQESSLIGAQVASYRSATGLLYKPDEDNCTNPEVFH